MDKLRAVTPLKAGVKSTLLLNKWFKTGLSLLVTAQWSAVNWRIVISSLKCSFFGSEVMLKFVPIKARTHSQTNFWTRTNSPSDSKSRIMNRRRRRRRVSLNHPSTSVLSRRLQQSLCRRRLCHRIRRIVRQLWNWQRDRIKNLFFLLNITANWLKTYVKSSKKLIKISQKIDLKIFIVKCNKFSYSRLTENLCKMSWAKILQQIDVKLVSLSNWTKNNL